MMIDDWFCQIAFSGDASACGLLLPKARDIARIMKMNGTFKKATAVGDAIIIVHADPPSKKISIIIIAGNPSHGIHFTICSSLSCDGFGYKNGNWSNPWNASGMNSEYGNMGGVDLSGIPAIFLDGTGYQSSIRNAVKKTGAEPVIQSGSDWWKVVDASHRKIISSQIFSDMRYGSAVVASPNAASITRDASGYIAEGASFNTFGVRSANKPWLMNAMGGFGVADFRGAQGMIAPEQMIGSVSGFHPVTYGGNGSDLVKNGKVGDVLQDDSSQASVMGVGFHGSTMLLMCKEDSDRVSVYYSLPPYRTRTLVTTQYLRQNEEVCWGFYMPIWYFNASGTKASAVFPYAQKIVASVNGSDLYGRHLNSKVAHFDFSFNGSGVPSVIYTEEVQPLGTCTQTPSQPTPPGYPYCSYEYAFSRTVDPIKKCIGIGYIGEDQRRVYVSYEEHSGYSSYYAASYTTDGVGHNFMQSVSSGGTNYMSAYLKYYIDDTEVVSIKVQDGAGSGGGIQEYQTSSSWSVNVGTALIGCDLKNKRIYIAALSTQNNSRVDAGVPSATWSSSFVVYRNKEIIYSKGA